MFLSILCHYIIKPKNCITYVVAKGNFLDTIGCLGPLPSRRSYLAPFWTLFIAESIWEATSLFFIASLTLCKCSLRASQQRWTLSFSSKASDLGIMQCKLVLENFIYMHLLWVQIERWPLIRLRPIHFASIKNYR